MALDKTVPPWTPEQVDALNRFQAVGYPHPFTCGGDHDQESVLVAHADGWRCPSSSCSLAGI